MAFASTYVYSSEGFDENFLDVCAVTPPRNNPPTLTTSSGSTVASTNENVPPVASPYRGGACFILDRYDDDIYGPTPIYPPLPHQRFDFSMDNSEDDILNVPDVHQDRQPEDVPLYEKPFALLEQNLGENRKEKVARRDDRGTKGVLETALSGHISPRENNFRNHQSTSSSTYASSSSPASSSGSSSSGSSSRSSLTSRDLNIISNSNSNERENLDTRELCARMLYELKASNIPQSMFAENVLGRSQGTLSDLLRNPKPWDSMKPSGRTTFQKMHDWLSLPLEQRLAIIHMKKNECDSTPVQMKGKHRKITSQNGEPIPKRTRVVFTDSQKKVLEKTFNGNQNPSREIQEQIANFWKLDVSTVANYFMNARRRSSRAKSIQNAEQH